MRKKRNKKSADHASRDRGSRQKHITNDENDRRSERQRRRNIQTIIVGALFGAWGGDSDS